MTVTTGHLPQCHVALLDRVSSFTGYLVRCGLGARA